MYVSQVLLQTKSKHEDSLRQIMKTKVAGMAGATGLISSECWKKDGQDEVGYCLVNKWENEDHYRRWLTEKSHEFGRHENADFFPRVPISRAALQYEVVDLDNE